MAITLDGLATTIVPDLPDASSLPFESLSFAGLDATTDYTVTITLSDITGDFRLSGPGSDVSDSSIAFTDTGAALTADLQSVQFYLNLPWEYVADDPVSLSFALTAPDAVALGSEDVACFAAGTLIRTARGEIPVERLRPGDMAMALCRGGFVPIRWVGRRAVCVAGHTRPWDVAPVRVRAHAFGPGRPKRDVRLSPDHAVPVDGVLLRIRDLINGATIVQEHVARVTYYHVELDRHDLLLADGLPAESFLDTGNRGAFEGCAAAPTIGRRGRACAKLVAAGPKLAAARTALRVRAMRLGWRVTGDAGLHARAGDVALRPAGGDFVLPAGTEAVTLASRRSVPAHMGENPDCRRLGVAVTRLALDGAAVALDDRRLEAGWHAPEPGLRWTDGAGTLRVDGARRLSVSAAPLLRYWETPAA